MSILLRLDFRILIALIFFCRRLTNVFSVRIWSCGEMVQLTETRRLMFVLCNSKFRIYFRCLFRSKRNGIASNVDRNIDDMQTARKQKNIKLIYCRTLLLSTRKCQFEHRFGVEIFMNTFVVALWSYKSTSFGANIRQQAFFPLPDL